MRAIALCAVAAMAVIGISGCGQTIAVQQTATPNSVTFISNIAKGGGGDVLAGYTCSTQQRGQCAGKVFQEGAHGLTAHTLNVAPIGETFVNREDG